MKKDHFFRFGPEGDFLLCCVFSPQKYYNYIRYGIDTQHTDPVEDSWLESILSRVPSHLKTITRSIEILSDEIREDYLMSTKKAIGRLLHRVLLVWEGERVSFTEHQLTLSRFISQARPHVE